MIKRETTRTNQIAPGTNQNPAGTWQEPCRNQPESYNGFLVVSWWVPGGFWLVSIGVLSFLKVNVTQFILIYFSGPTRNPSETHQNPSEPTRNQTESRNSGRFLLGIWWVPDGFWWVPGGFLVGFDCHLSGFSCFWLFPVL